MNWKQQRTQRSKGNRPGKRNQQWTRDWNGSLSGRALKSHDDEDGAGEGTEKPVKVSLKVLQSSSCKQTETQEDTDDQMTQGLFDVFDI